MAREAGTVNLTDFILARIAEDERDAEYDYGANCRCASPDRVLADCEAKRRIVETWLEDEGWGRHDPWVLEILASVYQDHPDFDPEWRLT